MLLSNAQRQKLCNMLGDILVEICNSGVPKEEMQNKLKEVEDRLERACNIAEAFHELPIAIWHDDFSFEIFREDFLKPCCRKYFLPSYYLSRLDEIEKMSGETEQIDSIEKENKKTDCGEDFISTWKEFLDTDI